MDPRKFIAICIFGINVVFPVVSVCLWYLQLITICTFITILSGFFFIFVIVPIIFKYSYGFQRSLLFLNFVQAPVDFEHPEKLRLDGTRNFRIVTKDNVSLGAWHVLPESLLLNASLRTPEPRDYFKWLNHGEPIFLYMHGNSGNRGSAHRVELYRMLQKNNFHVIAFDYRSYGDSDNVPPSETGVVMDSEAVYNWLKPLTGDAKIFFWGHSLGTGISSHLLDYLENKGEKITGIVLESPFTNIAEEVKRYPMAQFFRILPWFDYFFVEPLGENGLKFESDQHLKRVKTPILILHAEDDVIIPLELGEKLYRTIENSRENESNKNVQKVIFDKSHKYGHKLIYKDVNLPKVIKEFVRRSIQLQRP